MEGSEQQSKGEGGVAGGPAPARRPTRLWAVIVLVAILCGTILVGLDLVFYRAPSLMVAQSHHVLRTAGQAVATLLQLKPEVQERGVIVFYPPQERATWTAQEISFRVRHTFEHSWLRSQKRFSVEATARAGIGFDFQQPWRGRFDPARGVAEFSRPEPELLYLELSDFRVLADESGLLNRLTAADREASLNELRHLAEAKLDMEDLRARAHHSLENRLREVLVPLGFELVLQSQAPEPEPKP